ncbi:AAA family ATPase [Bremerella sp. JC817]|uniref:AAA family ATPase n=1 Tax=Bremerella sp. JC817 TaxID=3231756 RepID=UPI003458683F
MNWQELQHASLDRLIGWAETQPWCRAMAECAQDAQWHAEGDVWTHTQMVLRQLEELEAWPTIGSHDRTVLKFTALFHDVAKPLTTRLDELTGRITSPKHAVKGEHVARAVLRELGCDVMTREAICRLVRYHGRPVFLTERDDPQHEVVRLSWMVNNRLLYWFALADSRGRDTDSMSRPEENLDLWQLAAEEVNCFDQPYPFVSDHARFTFLRAAEPNLYYVPHEQFRCRVTLMAGLPGSGKDTWIQRHREDWPVVSLDDLRQELEIDPTENQGVVAQAAQERCRELLRAGTSFVFNATNTMRQTRGRWLDLFASYDAHVEIIYLEPDFREILRQNRARTQRVPESVIHRLAERCEPPTWWECHRLQYVAS